MKLEYGIVPEKWDCREIYGNHRFLVRATQAEYVRAVIPWRRHDGFFDKVGIIVRYGGDDSVGKNEVTDVMIEKADKAIAGGCRNLRVAYTSYDGPGGDGGGKCGILRIRLGNDAGYCKPL